jgi:hypothetical protein
MHRLKSIALGFAFSCCFSAFPDDSPRAQRFADDEPGILGQPQVVPLRDDQLDGLRGRMSVPMTQQHAGVVLWDEPRKPLPPHRFHGAAPSGAAGANLGATLSVVATVSRQ